MPAHWKNIERTSRFVVFAIFCSLLPMLSTSASASEKQPVSAQEYSVLASLTSADNENGDQDFVLPQDHTVSRSVNIDVHLESLVDSNGQAREHAHLTFPAFEKGILKLDLTRARTDNSTLAWQGKVNTKEQSDAIFILNEGHLTGNVTLDGNVYQFRSQENGQHVLRETDTSLLPEGLPPQVPPPELPPQLPPSPPQQIPDHTVTAEKDDGSQIDVMVVYTPEAKNQTGGKTPVESLIQLAITETNTGYANSNINTRLRLVHTAEIAHTEGSFTDDLTNLTSTTDGILDQVHTWRDTYGADVVILIRKTDPSACGLAWLMSSLTPTFETYAFGVVAHNCATGNFSFGHEIGHIQGSTHDKDNTGGSTGVSPYSQGWQDPAPNETFRTVMAYNCPVTASNPSGGCPRVNQYSNPAINYSGRSTGHTSTADNARSINDTANTVANFRAEVATPPTTTTTSTSTTTTTTTPSTTTTTTTPSTTTTTSTSTTTTTTTPSGGYWLAAEDGGVFAYGDAKFYGSMGGKHLNSSIIDITATPPMTMSADNKTTQHTKKSAGDHHTSKGYWLLGMDGGVFAYGDAKFYGSMGGKPLNDYIIDMTATPSGKGYWLVGLDGGVFAFGDAMFYGSMGGMHLHKPIWAIASTPTGKGYWIVSVDGSIFPFGDAMFYGSMGGKALNGMIIDIIPTPSGKGYWLMSFDGAIFTYGDAKFYGSMGSSPMNDLIIGADASPTGKGYWLTGFDGGVFAFGDAKFHGSMGGKHLHKPIMDIASTS